jgi:hypothetical protein
LAINMDLGVLRPCGANGFGVCSNDVVNSVLTAALGGACVVPTGIAFVQGNYSTPQTSQTTVTVPFTAAQVAGDLNVVVVGWNDSAVTVSSVTDQIGNIYTLAVGPTVQLGVATQSIYYAKNIGLATGGTNTVTVTFSSGAQNPDIRVLEYSGVDLNTPVDVTAANIGSSTNSSSGSVTTTNATDLLFAANLVQTETAGAGTGFANRMVTSPDGDIVEDQMVTSAGSYSATAPVSPSGSWIMQMVAFRTPASVSATSPTAPENLAATAASNSEIDLAWTASTDSAGVTGYRVERCQGSGCTNFAQVATPSSTSYSDTGLAANTTYSYRVRATDANGNLSLYSNVTSASTLSSTSPHSVTLNWTASTSSNIAGYNIYRSPNAAGPLTKLNTSLIIPTSYIDSTVQAGQTYFYVATAVDTSGNESVHSNQVQAVVPTP